MEKNWIVFLLISFALNSFGQPIVIGPKGTKLTIDSSKWKISGDNIYNKNSGRIGIGTANPTAQLHTTGDIRFQGMGANTSNTKILTSDIDGNITTRLLSNLMNGSAITSMNGLATSVQTLKSSTAGTDFNISSLGSEHTFNLPTASATNRGALSSADWSTFNAKENVLSFSNGLTRTGNSITVNTTQNITALTNLSTNGLIKTSGGAGTLSIATAGTDYSIGTSTLATGILKSTTGTGALLIATASDFPILNQNTTGNAATVTTNANLTGPVTSVGNATSIANNVITNSMLSKVTGPIFKGRNLASRDTILDLTPSQATAMLDTFTSTLRGLVPASGGGTTNFLRADGTFAIPPGSGRTIITLASDVVNNNNQANTLQDVGLSFNMIAGNTYRFNVLIPYTSEQVNNGSRWIVNCGASAPTFLSYVSRYSNGDASESINWCNFTSAPSTCNQNSTLTANLAVITGVIKASVNATFKIQFASATKNTAITAKAGASLEYW